MEKLKQDFISPCVGMERIFSGYSDTSVISNKTPAPAPAHYVCYFVTFSDAGKQKCIEVNNENSCDDEGNFHTLLECEEYTRCINGHSNFNISRIFNCL